MKFYQNDSLWDIESLENIFTTAYYYPAQNTIVFHYLSDIVDIDIQGPEFQSLFHKLFHKFYKRHEYINSDTKLIFIDLKTEEGFIDIVARMGLNEAATLMDGAAPRTNLFNRLPNADKKWYLAVKDTDPAYNPDKHGKLFGYNSYNYDETVMAKLLSLPFISGMNTPLDQEPISAVYNAKYIRESINDVLFTDSFIDSMPSFINGGKGARRDEIPANIKQGWRMTNRFIDVARLNEKMAKIGLKRIFAYLGLTIKEFPLAEGTRISNMEELANLFIYNASDVVNLRYVLEHRVYEVPFDLHKVLLDRYPQIIYQNKPGSLIEPNIKYNKVQRARLVLDSTSAKFVEKIVAPYNSLIDDECVNFMYPSKQAIQRIKRDTGVTVEQFDVLERTKEWFEKNVTNNPESPAHKDFMDVYNFYDHIRGSNFNTGRKYKEIYGEIDTREERDDGKGYFNKDRFDIHELLDKYNTNILYYDANAEPTSGYATFLIGGIHGAEYHIERYKHDVKIAEDFNAITDKIREFYPQVEDLILKAEDLGKKRNQFNKEAKVILDNGEEMPIPDLKKHIKNLKITPKTDQTHGEWSYKEVPKLFVRKKRQNSDFYKYELNKRYSYVSAGQANHEDFASYYPLLLSQISAFINPERLDENGEPIDTYYGLYQTRLNEKAKLNKEKYPDLSDEQRALANLTQNLMKLLINAGSGVGDSGFDNNLRVNNKIIKMRIIGQLFAYTIGQAQALEGARVVSTNTDGLFTMGITPEHNDRILNETVKSMYIDIEPEVIKNFVSKDTNNRMEAHHNDITTAGGGSLTAWDGPTPTNNLAHPAISDRILAEYLNKEPDAPNHHFNREHAFKLLHEFIDENKHTPEGRFELTRFFQWVVSSSDKSRRYVYTESYIDDQKIINEQQHYNRMFLVKDTFLKESYGIDRQTLKQTSKQKAKPSDPQPDAMAIFKEHGYNPFNDGLHGTTIKISGLSDEANVLIDNESLEFPMITNQYGPYGADFFDDVLDLEAYINYTEEVFENSWYNLQPNEF